MIWNENALVKISVLFNMKYADEFAHLGIGEDSDEIPAWENYLEEIGVSNESVNPGPCGTSPSPEASRRYWGSSMACFAFGADVFLLDPRFINVYRIIPGDLAEKVLVLGEFPVRQEV